MRSSLSRVAVTLVVSLHVMACTSAPSPAPASAQSPRASVVAPSPTAILGPTAETTASPSLPPLAATASLPVRRSAREIGERILMAAAPDGGLYVSVPRAGGAVLVLLDRSGRPRPGWPMSIKDSTSCDRPLPVADGSVRIICDGTDLPQFDNDLSDVRAFAYRSDGRLMAGWPVRLRPGSSERIVGDELTVLESQILTDTPAPDRVSHENWLTTVGADGTVRSGTKVPMLGTCCGVRWAVGPEAVVYGAVDGEVAEPGMAESSQLTAMDLSGLRAGWPVTIDGVASEAAFTPAGRPVVTVGSAVRNTSRVLVFDRDATAASAGQAELPITTIEAGVDCIAGVPRSPIVAQDGTIFVYGELDTAVFALDPSLKVMPGWPFTPPTPLERPDPARGQEGLNCLSLALPAVGPDRTLFLPLQARNAKVGGSIFAVGPSCEAGCGWPVELKRHGSEFWSIVVGSDGTVHALAIEPESGGAWSASVLGIAPDSTVRYVTTIVEP